MSGLVFLFAVSGAVLGFTLKSIPSTLKHPRVQTPDLEVPLRFDNVIIEAWSLRFKTAVPRIIIAFLCLTQ